MGLLMMIACHKDIKNKETSKTFDSILDGLQFATMFSSFGILIVNISGQLNGAKFLRIPLRITTRKLIYPPLNLLKRTKKERTSILMKKVILVWEKTQIVAVSMSKVMMMTKMTKMTIKRAFYVCSMGIYF